MSGHIVTGTPSSGIVMAFGDASEPPWAELDCLTNYSFLQAASHPEELVSRASDLGYAALAITDASSLGGVVRAHLAAKKHDLPLIIGASCTWHDHRFILLAQDRSAYAWLSTTISTVRQRARGQPSLPWRLREITRSPCLVIWIPPRRLSAISQHRVWGLAAGLYRAFGDRLSLGVHQWRCGDDPEVGQRAQEMEDRMGLKVVALGGALMHAVTRKPLLDCMTAMRHNTTLDDMERRGYLASNAERSLRAPEDHAHLFPLAWRERALEVAQQCRFDLSMLNYHYPRELVPEGTTEASWLKELTMRGARTRWPKGPPASVVTQIDAELTVIAELGYERFFFTVHDIVAFAQSRGILCQGRGSAANSVVCYCLGITNASPEVFPIMFERFISHERDEPPDIDVDVANNRRQEVFDHIRARYGVRRAALVSTTIRFRYKSAMRGIAGALGLAPDAIARLARDPATVMQVTDPAERERLVQLVEELRGMPRHRSQHVGGFVMSDAPLDEIVPIERAAMDDRWVIEWDKDDVSAMGMIKVDVLALGMLSALDACFTSMSRRLGHRFTFRDIPGDDRKTWDMIGRADTVGVFQIESRAQMAMLPRLKPRCFYDLVVEIALIRPGPIQGDMVHPYLRRRFGKEAVHYESPDIKRILERTLGVPLFQEQVMQLAVSCAGYTGGEADGLRRSMASWGKSGDLEPHRQRFTQGMQQRGYTAAFAQTLFGQLRGFGAYGFPESHAVSFAIIAWMSCWLKCHYPADFITAILNCQPMGFYRPSQLIQDVQRCGVTVLPPCLDESEWESVARDDATIQLGFGTVKGLSQERVGVLLRERHRQAWRSLGDMVARTGMPQDQLRVLVRHAGRRYATHRREAHWQVAHGPATPLFAEMSAPAPPLPRASMAEVVAEEYRDTGHSLTRHPIALLRPLLPAHVISSREITKVRSGRHIEIAGLVTARQRPQTANGVMFCSLEDEWGQVNLIVWPNIQQQLGRLLVDVDMWLVSGKVQMASDGPVTHLVVAGIQSLAGQALQLPALSRNFR